MKSERMKTELITNVSHDIKTPLTSIISYVDLLDKQNIADAQENTMRNIWVGGIANTANKYFAVRNM